MLEVATLLRPDWRRLSHHLELACRAAARGERVRQKWGRASQTVSERARTGIPEGRLTTGRRAPPCRLHVPGLLGLRGDIALAAADGGVPGWRLELDPACAARTQPQDTRSG